MSALLLLWTKLVNGSFSQFCDFRKYFLRQRFWKHIWNYFSLMRITISQKLQTLPETFRLFWANSESQVEFWAAACQRNKGNIWKIRPLISVFLLFVPHCILKVLWLCACFEDSWDCNFLLVSFWLNLCNTICA